MGDFLATVVRALGGASMLKFIFRRVLAGIPVLFGICFVTFLLMRAMPAGPFDFIGTKATPPSVKAALEQRFGLDKPFLLNMPNDGVAPDNNMETRWVFEEKKPLCSGLRSGQSVAEATPANNYDTYSGWSLVRLVTEYRTAETVIDGKSRSCIETSTVLYSDLTRSQFFNYFNNMLRLDFGLSLGRTTLGTPVWDLISDRLPVSMQLGFLVIIFSYAVGIPLGVIAALRRNTWVDYSSNLFNTIVAATPTLVLGPLLIILFVQTLRILPAPDPRVWKGGSVFDWNYLSRALIPILVLGLGGSAGIARFTRANVLQVLRDDYIRTARAKGLRERVVIFVHALKNSLIPVVSGLGVRLAGVLTGTLIIERIFAIPGLGSSFIDSISARDYNLLIGVQLLYSVFLITGNILVDVTYTWLDPRIRFD